MSWKALLDFIGLAMRPLARTPDVRDWWEISQVVVTSGLGISTYIFSPQLGESLGASPWQSRLVGVLALLVLLFGIAGWRLALRVRKTVTPILKAITDISPNVEGDVWLRLRVDNPTATPIPDCYGKLLEISRVASDGAKIALAGPRDGHKYPWQRHGGGVQLTRNIGAFDHDYLDIFVYRKKPGEWRTVGVVIMEEKIISANENFPIPNSGIYNLVIQVGASAVSLMPTFFRARLNAESRQWTGEQIRYPTNS